jgi:hypothetical protein
MARSGGINGFVSEKGGFAEVNEDCPVIAGRAAVKAKDTAMSDRLLKKE